jgi:DNA-binding LytR/AlgR family response regulator
MKLNCLIVDDEPVARQGLAEYVREVSSLTLCAECENAVKASAVMAQEAVDLIFLDIHMPKLTGIDFLKTLKNPPLVILTTAYPDYALEGYALDVVDYLLKPIPFERFMKAVQKAVDIHTLRHQQPGLSPYFFVKADSKFEKIVFDEVLYIEALQNYVIIHTTTRRIISYLTMSGLESQLPKDRFLKVHKSYIVALPHIQSIEGNELIIGSARVPISRALKEEVVNQIVGNKLFRR